MLLLSFISLFNNKVIAEEKERKIIFQSTVNLLEGEQIERIVLSGVEKEGSPFYEDVKLTVFDEKSGKLLYSITPNVNFGYQPKLSFIDFDLDGVMEVFYSAESGIVGGGGYFYVFGFNGKINTYYDFDLDKKPFTAKYQDYYKVSVKRGEKEFLIDICKKGNDYLNKIYTPNGKLQKQTLASVSKVYSVIPYYNYAKNKHFIKVLRKVSGENPNDCICYANVDLELENYEFKQVKLSVEI